jgi:hypothetical protein
MIAPHSKVYHAVGGSRRRLQLPLRRKQSIFLSHRNLFRSVLKTVPGRDLFPTMATNYLALLVQAVAEAVVLKEPVLIAQHVRAMAWNLSNLSDTLTEREIIQRKHPSMERLSPVVDSAMFWRFMQGVRRAIGRAMVGDSLSNVVPPLGVTSDSLVSQRK